MIDLSHLTEEEQGVIMTVLRRDAELKKNEEERIRNLEKILDSGSQSDIELKYRTGEWFYEAKSRRHMDKIHGSEIILASMKQRNAGLDGSPRMERSRTPSSRGSDIVPPPKPARLLEALQPQKINDAEKDNLNSALRSPRTPRHNPFNRASLIVVDPPENNDDSATSRDQETSETEPISPLRSRPAESGQTSGGSITSEGSSVGYRPVPKKRTFLSRQTSTQSESNSQVSEAQGGSAGIVPAPRRSLQRGSSESSNQSCQKSQDETPQKNEVSNQVSQPSKPLEENSMQPVSNVSQVSSNSSLERERNPPSITRDRSVNDSDPNSLIKPSHPSTETHNLHNYRPATSTRSEASTDREIPQKIDGRDDWTQREHEALNTVALNTGSIQESDRGNNSSVGTGTRPETELSLPQSSVDPDPPVSYDLNFIDKSDQQTKKSNQKNAFQLSTQTSSPTGDEDDSIAKVLDWFNRSTDSLDLLNTDDSPKVSKSSAKQVEISKLRGRGSFRKGAGDTISDRKDETLEMWRNHLQRQSSEAKELRATDRTGNKELVETQEDMKKERMVDYDDESQQPQISDLKSFWEKSSKGPKILVSKSITPDNKGQKPVQEKVNKPHRAPDMPSVPGIFNGKGIYEKSASNHGDESEQQKDTEDSFHTSTQWKSNDVKLAASPLLADRRGSDAEILCETRLSPQPRTRILSSPQPDSISSLQYELSKAVPASQLDTDPDSEKLYMTRTSPYMEYKQADTQVAPRTPMQRSSSEDVKRADSEDKGVQSSMSPKRREDTSNKDRAKGLQHQESTAEKIKQLKSFWEQERNKQLFYKPIALGEGKVCRGNQAKLNKRYTKSEFDLTLVGKESGSDEEDADRNHHNFTVLPLNQRLDKLSPSLGTSRIQFNTLREFWGEAMADTKGQFPYEKPKSPKRKEPISAQLSCQELKSGDPEVYSKKTRPTAMKSSPPLQSRPKSPHERQAGSTASSEGKNSLSSYTAESRRSSKDSYREEKSTKPPSGSRSPNRRKDSFGNSSSRGNSIRRAASMFCLDVPDEKELKMDVHSQSRKQRQNAERGTSARRSSDETETLTPPRARAYVPRDYRHYLGMTDETSVHASLAPTGKDKGSEGKSGYEFDLGGPVRTSTPVSSEERYSRRGGKNSQRPLWANHSGSDGGQESSVSSMSESWTNSRNSSTRETDVDAQNLVRRALRRAETRPKNLAKSMEDITASLSPRQERRQDPTADTRYISDASPIPSPPSSSFSDPDHLKKMSKSVPSFLQKEDFDRDSWEDNARSRSGTLMTGSPFSTLTGSSLSSLSGSVMTMYSGDFGNVEVQGNIQFSINYVQRLREFHIFVVECQDLAAVDPKRGRSDPYVKSYLVPDKANLGKRKTSVKKKTLNPTFNEILRYRVRMEYLRTQTLILSVWHNDTFGRNSFLGEVDVNLSKWDFDHTQMNYLALKARTGPTLAPSHGRGEMRLAVRFLPQVIHSEGLVKASPNSGEVHIWVKECKNLPLIRATIDPYVKCFVLPDTSRKSRQKTRVLRRTADPAFNHTMVYDGIREADLPEACVELTVWDRDRLASNLLGGLRLGAGTGRSYGAPVDWMDSTPYEVSLWERMMATPNEWVEDVLPLRVLNSSKTGYK